MIKQSLDGQTNEAEKEGNTEKGMDLSYLIGLSNGNKDFERQIITLFIQTAPGKVEQLHRYIETGNVYQIRKQTHHLRGSMQIMGLTGVLRYLEQIDGIADQADETEKALNYCNQMLQMTEAYIKLLRSEINQPDDLTSGPQQDQQRKAD